VARGLPANPEQEGEKIMADRPTDRRGDEPVSRPISKGTYIMLGAVVLFLIIAAVLFFKFLSAPTGNP
jgi:hypothetical protein